MSRHANQARQPVLETFETVAEPEPLKLIESAQTLCRRLLESGHAREHMVADDVVVSLGALRYKLSTVESEHQDFMALVEKVRSVL